MATPFVHKEENKGEAPEKKEKRGEERTKKREKERSSRDVLVPVKERKYRVKSKRE